MADPFADSLQRAKRRRQIWLVSIGLLLATAVIAYAFMLVIAKGHAFKVMPLSVQAHYQVVVQQGGWMFNQRLYTLGGTAQITISAPLYQPQPLTILPDSPEVIEVLLQPQPATVKLTTTPAFADTQWYLDNELVAVSETWQRELPPGQYQLLVKHPFVKDTALTIDAQKGQQLNQALELTRLEGQISIGSEPNGAQVWLNDTELGVTPLTLPKTGGEYPIKLLLDGYAPLSDTLAVTHNEQSVSRNYRLMPLPATLIIALAPEGGVLTVDGQTLPTAAAVQTEVPSNRKVTISYRKPGFYPAVLSDTYAPLSQTPVSIALEPEMGEVSITSNVPAQVEIDNQVVGTTPQQLTLPAIATDIRLSKPFYREQTLSLIPSAQQVQVVDVTLQTEFSARRQAGQPTKAAQLGIALTRFTPSAFVMGAPVNDSLRRSNEHQIQVAFSQPFLISKHEVTEAQFAAYSGQSSRSARPQTNVTWQQAALFCNWLSAQDAIPPFYVVQDGQVVGSNPTASGYRLVTEAEWEYVARAANRASQTRYVWGDRDALPNGIGNLADSALLGSQPFVFRDYSDSHPGVAPVGSYRAERSGLFDLVGNVSEWVHDVYTLQPPPTDAVMTDYLGLSQQHRNAQHVTKGGNYLTGRLHMLRASYREAGEASDTVGFRVARYFYDGQ